MTRIAFVTDLHVREEEAELHGRLLHDAAKIIDEARPSLVLVGGDLTGWTVPHRASIVERNLVTDFICEILAPVVVIRGNHDEPADWNFLRSVMGVRYVEEPILFAGNEDNPEIACLPWVDSTSLKIRDGQTKGEAMQAYWTSELRAFPEQQSPRVLLSHAALKGAHWGDAQPRLAIDDAAVDADRLMQAAGAIAGFFGHYHARQEVAPGAWYGGSLFVNGYGEDPNKGITIWEDGVWSFRRLPQPWKMLACVDAKGKLLSASGFEAPEKTDTRTLKAWIKGLNPPPGSRLRIRFNLEQKEVPDARVIAQGVAESLHGRATVEVEYRVEQSERVRPAAIQVSEAQTSAGKFIAWTESLSVPPDPQLLGDALQELGRIESNLAGKS